MAHGLFVLTAAGNLESIPVKAGDAHSVSAAGIMTLFESRSGDHLDRHAWWRREHSRPRHPPDSPASLRARATRMAQASRMSAPLPRTRTAISGSALTAAACTWRSPMAPSSDRSGTIRKTGRLVARQHHLCDRCRFAGSRLGRHRRRGLARVVGIPGQPGCHPLRGVTREQGLSSDTIYGVMSGRQRALVAQWQRRAGPLRSRLTAP